jgi:hypothetical protein
VRGQGVVVLAEMTLRSLSDGLDVGHRDFLMVSPVVADMIETKKLVGYRTTGASGRVHVAPSRALPAVPPEGHP